MEAEGQVSSPVAGRDGELPPEDSFLGSLASASSGQARHRSAGQVFSLEPDDEVGNATELYRVSRVHSMAGARLLSRFMQQRPRRDLAITSSNILALNSNS